MPDYTAQLQEIVKALNRPATSPWLIAAFAASLGFVGGIIGQAALMWMSDLYRLYKMRRLLYREIADMFLTLDGIMDQNHIDDLIERMHWQAEQVKTYLNFRSEQYMTVNQELYVHLPEHFSQPTYSTNVSTRSSTSRTPSASIPVSRFGCSRGQCSANMVYDHGFWDGDPAKHLFERVEYHQRIEQELRRRVSAR